MKFERMGCGGEPLKYVSWWDARRFTQMLPRLKTGVVSDTTSERESPLLAVVSGERGESSADIHALDSCDVHAY